MIGRVASLRHQGELLMQLTKRDIFSRYRGSALGILWSFITPLLLVGVYTFVFSVIFRPRWMVEGATVAGGYGFNLFVGMIIHNVLAECIARAPSLVLGNANYVTKVVFPLQLLPSVVVLSALFHLLIGFIALIALQLVMGVHIDFAMFAALPLVLLPLAVICNGLVLILSALGVYFRDLSQIVSVLIAALMFLSPVFYPITAVPEAFRHYLYLNPMTYIIESARGVILNGQVPDYGALLMVTGIGCALIVLGAVVFQKLRRGFADVL